MYHVFIFGLLLTQTIFTTHRAWKFCSESQIKRGLFGDGVAA
jgi:hypothetical protein